MIVTGLDLETTGLKWDDATNPDRITQICMIPYSLATRRPLLIFDQMVYSGRSINKKAEELTGITNASLVGKPTFAQIAAKVAMLLERSDVVVIHNSAFDALFLDMEFGLAGVKMPNVVVADTMTDGMWASYDSKPPSLKELCYACGVEYDPALAHRADYDVKVMMECFFIACDRGWIDVPAMKKEIAA